MPSAFLKKLKIGIDFSESFAIIITLSLQGSKQLYQQRSTGTAMEKSPSWSRAHDWKSCRPLKGLEGSNPSFSAIESTEFSSFWVEFGTFLSFLAFHLLEILACFLAYFSHFLMLF